MKSALLENFEALADARSGIPKLRELILELAVRGRLVPQDPSEEPASELLRKIRAERQRLLSEGQLRTTRLPGSCAAAYTLPRSWEWTPLGVCIDLISGQHLLPSEQNMEGQGLPYLTGPAEFGDVSPEPARWTTERRAVAEKGDLLLTVKGAGVGKTNIVHQPELAISRQLMALRCIVVDRLYVRAWLTTRQEEFRAAMSGIAIPGIRREDILGVAFPLPPLAEQSRIVAKVDALMTLCDNLQAKQENKRAVRVALNHACLRAVTQPNGTGFGTAWRRVRDNFDDLYCVPETVAELRQTILQLAVMGHLVPQDPEDEPAAPHLVQSRTENGEGRAERRPRTRRPAPLSESSSSPYQPPSGWEWKRLQDVACDVHYGYTAPADASATETRLLRITDIQNDSVDWESVPGCAIGDREAQKYLLADGDIVIARTGGTIGKSYLVQLPPRAVFASYLIRVIPSSLVRPRFLKVFLGAPLYWDQLSKSSQGTGQPNVNATSLKCLSLPLPPLAEQERIVAKVEQLMTLCDGLEAKLRQFQAGAGRLLTAIIHELAPEELRQSGDK